MVSGTIDHLSRHTLGEKQFPGGKFEVARLDKIPGCRVERIDVVIVIEGVKKTVGHVIGYGCYETGLGAEIADISHLKTIGRVHDGELTVGVAVEGHNIDKVVDGIISHGISVGEEVGAEVERVKISARLKVDEVPGDGISFESIHQGWAYDFTFAQGVGLKKVILAYIWGEKSVVMQRGHGAR